MGGLKNDHRYCKDTQRLEGTLLRKFYLHLNRDHSCAFWQTNSGCNFYDSSCCRFFFFFFIIHCLLEVIEEWTGSVRLTAKGKDIQFFFSFSHCTYNVYIFYFDVKPKCGNLF